VYLHDITRMTQTNLFIIVLVLRLMGTAANFIGILTRKFIITLQNLDSFGMWIDTDKGSYFVISHKKCKYFLV